MRFSGIPAGGRSLGIDSKIGVRIKQARKNLRLSQMALADRIGVSYQQVQKYERGSGRLSLFRLAQIADALGLPLLSLLAGVDDNGNGGVGVGEPESEYGHDLPGRHPVNREEAELLALFRRLECPDLRAGVLLQLKGLVAIVAGSRRQERR